MQSHCKAPSCCQRQELAGSSASIPNAQCWPALVAETACQLSMLISKCFVKDYSKINFRAWDKENSFYGEVFPLRLVWHNMGLLTTFWYPEGLGTIWPSVLLMCWGFFLGVFFNLFFLIKHIRQMNLFTSQYSSNSWKKLQPLKTHIDFINHCYVAASPKMECSSCSYYRDWSQVLWS